MANIINAKNALLEAQVANNIIDLINGYTEAVKKHFFYTENLEDIITIISLAIDNNVDPKYMTHLVEEEGKCSGVGQVEECLKKIVESKFYELGWNFIPYRQYGSVTNGPIAITSGIVCYLLEEFAMSLYLQLVKNDLHKKLQKGDVDSVISHQTSVKFIAFFKFYGGKFQDIVNLSISAAKKHSSHIVFYRLAELTFYLVPAADDKELKDNYYNISKFMNVIESAKYVSLPKDVQGFIDEDEFKGGLKAAKNVFKERNITPPLKNAPIIASGVGGSLLGGGAALGMGLMGKLPGNSIGMQAGALVLV